ncbi:MAG: transglycosylase SLT domain-containing protein [Pseudomonadota bacterium]|nr:transglycosylase SLT domain-containing protein [Pseudomonadota bacterium]
MPNRYLFLSFILFFLGCASSEVSTTETIAPPPEIAEIPTLPVSEELIQEVKVVDAVIEPKPHSEVPIEINANVQKWISYFSIKDKERFKRFLERGLYYKDVVQGILREHGVPTDLYYLAMIESGYVTHARSRQNAVGAWQFMRATGKHYGLHSDRDLLDERRDIIRSTESAAKYLKDLHNEFGSWYLALAGYNAGEGRIRRGIRKGKSNDFWKLVHARKLPRETMNYVPKFLAAVIIGKNPEKHGFENLHSEKFPEIAKVKIPPLIQLKQIAELAQIPLANLVEINPHLLREVTPQIYPHYEIWAPKDQAQIIEGFVSQLTPIENDKIPKPSRSYSSDENTKSHRVRWGENLLSIARRYGLSVSALKKFNGLKSDRIFKGQRLKLYAVN